MTTGAAPMIHFSLHDSRADAIYADNGREAEPGLSDSMLPPFAPMPVPEKETLKEKILREKMDRANKERWEQEAPQRLEQLRAQKKLESEMRLVQLQSTAGRSPSVLP